MSKVLTVLGARPQFVKAAALSRKLVSAGLQEVMVHTGQHYDPQMSNVFFSELGLPVPAYQLEVGSGSRIHQVSEAMKRLEPVLEKEKPDLVLVYGDTNATFAGAFGAIAHNIPYAHVEAGLRSFNQRMPEETNRILTDRMARWCFAPTETAMANLANEGLANQAHWVGDIMLDTLLYFKAIAQERYPAFLEEQGLKSDQYWLLTLHRAETTAEPELVKRLLRFLDQQDKPVLFPVHPRIASLVDSIQPFRNIRCVQPLGYLHMLLSEGGAERILTDSGGVQKESAMLGIPCITLRHETEWTETVELGTNTLVGLSMERLAGALAATSERINIEKVHHLYGNGQAGARIVDILQKH